MSGSEHARPVWLTPSQRQVIESINEYGRFSVLYVICDAWDAAPADPAEAVMIALYDHDKPDVENEGILQDQAVAVLRALGSNT